MWKNAATVRWKSVRPCRNMTRDSKSRPGRKAAASASRAITELTTHPASILSFWTAMTGLSPICWKDCLRKLKKKGEVDVLTFACVKTYQENEELSKPSDLKRVSNFTADDADKVFSGQDMLRRAHRHMTGMFYAYAWLSVCRLAFLREHNLYQRKTLMEDFEWTPRLWFFAKKMIYMDNVLYYYRVRPVSLMTSADSKNRIMLAFSERVFPSLFDFACSESVPEDILCGWSNLWLSELYWYLFHPITSKNISDKNRMQALNALFSEKGRDHFHQIVQHASFPKRIAAPFILLAEKGILFPAKVFFRSLYYPLVQRKKKS